MVTQISNFRQWVNTKVLIHTYCKKKKTHRVYYFKMPDVVPAHISHSTASGKSTSDKGLCY